MSYDVRFGVKVEGMNGYIAVVDEPQYSSPTYNLLAKNDTFYERLDHYSSAAAIIIGNIYDNPELLEEVSVNA